MNHNIFRKNEEIHKIVHFYEILSNNDEYLEKLSENIKKFRLKIDLLKVELNKLTNIINSVINNFEIYYNIYYDLIANYEIVERNYHILKNIKNIKFAEIFKDLDNIISEGHFYKKFEKTFEVYNKMSCLSEITIQYYPDTQKKIKLFGQKFIINNKEKCKLSINNNFYELFDTLKISKDLEKQISANNGIFEVKLCIDKNEYLTDMSYMFKDCSSLLFLPDISDINTFHVTDMSYLFYGCSLLEQIPNISKWNISNVKNLGYMFFNCNSLTSLPDLANWDISSVKDLSHLFSNCASLTKLPNNISCWNTKKVENLSYLFYYCVSLKELPDISKWDISNVNDISYMFSCCKSLTKLPDISIWNTEKVTNIEYLFYGCKSLNSIPDISKWNTKNVTNMGFMFDELNNKVKIPKINPSECSIL
jgi:surface protein